MSIKSGYDFTKIKEAHLKLFDAQPMNIVEVKALLTQILKENT